MSDPQSSKFCKSLQTVKSESSTAKIISKVPNAHQSPGKLVSIAEHNKQAEAGLNSRVIAIIILSSLLVHLVPHLSLIKNRGAQLAAAQAFEGESANEVPSGGDSSFNEDDDDDDGGSMDASASNDYPDGDGGDGDGDDAYGDSDGAESHPTGRWTPAQVNHESRVRSTVAPGRRRKRDLDDAKLLETRRLTRARSLGVGGNRKSPLNKDDEEFGAVDDGDEDAWVHDGVDDIHIDPETKRAASELSYETDKSIDQEYEPHQSQERDVGLIPSLINRTRVTTIAEVIPMGTMDSIEDDGGGTGSGFLGDRESSKISRRFTKPPTGGASLYLPAAYLNMDQVVKLIEEDREARDEEQEEASERPRPMGRPLAVFASDHNQLNQLPTDGDQNSLEQSTSINRHDRWFPYA